MKLLAALFISTALLTAVRGILERSPVYLITVLGVLLIGLIPAYFYWKRSKAVSYDGLCLSPEAAKKLLFYLDRHKKRAINSICIAVCGIVLFVSLTSERALVSSMNNDELIVLFLTNGQVIKISLIVLIKNFGDVHFLLRFVPDRERTAFWNYIKKEYLIVFVSFAAITAVTAALVLAVVNQFQKDVYVLQPYIMSVSGVEHSRHAITYDKKTGEYTITADDGDFKILHLTDIHLGGSVVSSYKDYKALEACKKLIEHTRPDFVVVTGDMVFPMGIMSFSLNNEAPVIQFASFMRNIGIPWAFTYGNHDTEAMATGSREDLDELYRSLSYETSGTLLYPYIKPDITGRCNQLIHIRNADGSERQAVFLIDSNDYTGEGINEYDYIHDDQVEWYAEQVQKLSKEQGETVSSMIFFHIPLQEYRTAYLRDEH